MAKFFKSKETFKPVYCQVSHLQIQAGQDYPVLGRSKAFAGYWILVVSEGKKWDVFLTSSEWVRGEVKVISKRTKKKSNGKTDRFQ